MDLSIQSHKLVGLSAILLLSLIANVTQVLAQTPYVAKVKLQNGQVVKGYVSGCTDDGQMKLEFGKSPEVTVSMEDIRNIRFLNGFAHAGDSLRGWTSYDPLRIGKFFHQFDVGILLNGDQTDFGLHVINGYQFHQFLGAGLGIGMEKYGDFTTMPLFAQVRGYIRDHRLAPFYHGSAGYGFAWYDNTNNTGAEAKDINGGIFWEVGIGYKWHLSPLSLTFNLGYKQQVAVRKFEAPNYFMPWMSNVAPDPMEISEKNTFRRVSLSIGVLF